MGTVAVEKKEEAKRQRSVLADMADRYGVPAAQFWDTLQATIMPKGATQAQTIAFLLVAKRYNLDPFTKQIYAFPTKGGGIQPMVPIDGWMQIINSHSAFDGMTFHDNLDGDGKLVSITCRMYRKDRSHAVEATEYMDECMRGTDPWNTMPRRMLRHKAAIQAGRYAFSLAGIIDEDEAERYKEMGVFNEVEEAAAVDLLPDENIDTDTGEVLDADPAAADDVPEPEDAETATQ